MSNDNVQESVDFRFRQFFIDKNAVFAFACKNCHNGSIILLIDTTMAQTKVNLTKNLKEIDEIVAWFDAQEEVDIEEAIAKVKKGAKVIKESKKRLEAIENEFEDIKKDLAS